MLQDIFVNIGLRSGIIGGGGISLKTGDGGIGDEDGEDGGGVAGVAGEEGEEPSDGVLEGEAPNEREAVGVFDGPIPAGELLGEDPVEREAAGVLDIIITTGEVLGDTDTTGLTPSKHIPAAHAPLPPPPAVHGKPSFPGKQVQNPVPLHIDPSHTASTERVFKQSGTEHSGQPPQSESPSHSIHNPTSLQVFRGASVQSESSKHPTHIPESQTGRKMSSQSESDVQGSHSSVPPSQKPAHSSESSQSHCAELR